MHPDPEFSPGAYRFGPFRLDPARRVLTCEGVPVALRPTLLEVLLHFVQHPGRVIGKAELMDAVWPRRAVEESNLSQAVFWLRAALRDAAGESADGLIATERGKGYRFDADVRREGAPAPAGVPDAPTTTPSAVTAPASSGPALRTARPRRKAWRAPAGLAVAMVAAGGIGWAVLHAPRRLGPGNTVVLADFINRTGEPTFDRTLGDVLRTDLSQSPYVTVMPEKQARDLLVLAKRPPDAALTVAAAREVCARGNADAVLGGRLDPHGARYALTLTATPCSGRDVLAEESAEALDRQAVASVLHRLIGRMRARLGEPVRSVRRFDVPLAPERTASLEALKAFSEGLWLNDHGRRNEAIPAFRRAVTLDPGFAAAYASLSVVYGGTNQDALAAQAMTQAWRLRDSLNARERLRVETLYQQLVQRDFGATVESLEQWTLLYPSDAKAWTNLANVHNVLGRYDLGVAAGLRAVELHPALETPYVVLARAYLRSGRPDAAIKVGEAAIRQGLAGDATHGVLLGAALMKGDEDGVQREMAWPRGAAAERILLVIEGQIAYGRGKVREGDLLFDQSAELSRQQGLPDFARAYRARLLIDLGLPERARRVLATFKDEDDDDFIFAEAEIGDAAMAKTRLAEQERRYPHGTLIRGDFGPEVRAALALRHHAPAEAIDALQRALAYQSRTFDIPYVLGRAYLEAGNGPRARAAFQLIRDHRGWYPESPLYQLAQLGLARAFRLEGDLPRARRAYLDVFNGWREADGDLSLLKAARREYAGL